MEDETLPEDDTAPVEDDTLPDDETWPVDELTAPVVLVLDT